MKRICIYCQTWSSGGIEAFLFNVLTHMDRSGLTVDIVVEVWEDSLFTDKLEAIGITFQKLSGSRKHIGKNCKLFAELMRERKYDVLHLNVFQALQLAYLPLAKMLGIPVRIAHSHNTMLRQSITKPFKSVVHKLAKQCFAGFATEHWACSNDAARFLFPTAIHKKRRYRFIPNGIDIHRFQFDAAWRDEMRKELNLEDAFVIGHIGRLCYQKNQKFLLDVFAKVYEENPNVRLLLVGEGEALAELQRKVEILALQDVVIFYGTSFHIERLFWAMDVFVFPSIFEGLGIVAIEAQAAGLPTICSDKVPQEVFATDLAKQIPLNAPIERWRDAVVHARGKRQDTGTQLKKSGFDIGMVSAEIGDVYRR